MVVCVNRSDCLFVYAANTRGKLDEKGLSRLSSEILVELERSRSSSAIAIAMKAGEERRETRYRLNYDFSGGLGLNPGETGGT